MLGALAFTSPSFAAESKSATADAEFRKLDTNKDGKVSASEHAAGTKQMFETMDGNKDGKVTAAEMEAAHQRITGRKAKSDMSAAEQDQSRRHKWRRCPHGRGACCRLARHVRKDGHEQGRLPDQG